jgi:hypothetical protein
MVSWSNRGQVNKEVLRGPQDERFEGLCDRPEKRNFSDQMSRIRRKPFDNRQPETITSRNWALETTDIVR